MRTAHELPPDPIMRLVALGQWIRSNRRFALAVAACVVLTIAGWSYILTDDGPGFSRGELTKMNDLPLPPPGAGGFVGGSPTGPLPEQGDLRMLEDLKSEADSAPRPDLLDGEAEDRR